MNKKPHEHVKCFGMKLTPLEDGFKDYSSKTTKKM
jgi:hypothetical protein